MTATTDTRILFKTLTPIWTGDIEGYADKELSISGLMGSLRWWWEVLERGVSAVVRNVDEQNPDDGAGRLFGATGRRRAFRLIVNESQLKPARMETRIRIDGSRGWFFKSDALAGTFQLQVVPLRLPSETELVRELFGFISRYGALGARPQMGFGVIEPIYGSDNIPRIAQRLKNDMYRDNGTQEIWDGGMPALNNMFFCEVTSRRGDEQFTFELKALIRNLYRHDDDLRHFLCGYIVQGSDERMGSKIMVSRPYCDPKTKEQRIRIWGWFPRTVRESLRRSRGSALQTLHDFLASGHPDLKIKRWRELGSDRDTVEKVLQGSIIFYLKLMRSYHHAS